MTNATKRPWKVLWKYDTHKVKRDRDGRIIGPVTMDFEDYLVAVEAVNQHDALVAENQRLRDFVQMIANGGLDSEADHATIEAEAQAALAGGKGE